MHRIGFLISGFRFIRFELHKLGLKGARIFAENLQDNTAGPREKQPANQVSFPQLLACIVKTLITKKESSHRTFQGQLCNRAIQFSWTPTSRWLGIIPHAHWRPNSALLQKQYSFLTAQPPFQNVFIGLDVILKLSYRDYC